MLSRFNNIALSFGVFGWVGNVSILLITLLASSPVMAQGLPNSGLADPATQLRQEQRLQRERERIENARPGQKIEIQRPERVQREAVCFPVKTIRLRGVSVIDPSKLASLIEPYKDTCMGQKAIGALIELVNKIYVEEGYITTRAYVPQQDLSSGELAIEVLEGRIEGFVYRLVDKDGNITAGKPRKIAIAFPIKPGEVFQLRSIEQGIDQINRLQSSTAKIDLLPGSKPGTSLVVVTEQKNDLYRATLSYDNRGSETTGLNRVRATFEADDIFALNDAHSVSYVGTRNTNVVSYNWSMPYGNWTFSASGSYSESLDALSLISDLFNQTGNVSLTAERLLSRNAKQKTYVYGRAGYYWNSRFVNLAELTPQNRTSLGLGVRTEHFFENSTLTANIGLNWGVPFLGADEDIILLTQPGAPPLPFDNTIPRAEFTKFDFSVNYLHRFKNGSRYNGSLIGQFSGDTLFSEQQLTIGGWESVRGFQGNSFAGERGALMRNEFSFVLPEWAWKSDNVNKQPAFQKFYNEKLRAMQPYLYLDAGSVHNLALGETVQMAGTGFGIRGSVGRASIDASLALPLTQHNQTNPGDIQGLINVSYKLF